MRVEEEGIQATETERGGGKRQESLEEKGGTGERSLLYRLNEAKLEREMFPGSFGPERDATNRRVEPRRKESETERERVRIGKSGMHRGDTAWKGCELACWGWLGGWVGAGTVFKRKEKERGEQRVVGALLIPVCADWAKRGASGSTREREGPIYGRR